jgi:uncharacterized protein
MPQSVSRRLPSRQLAAEQRTLSGRIDAAELAPRLAAALAREHPVGTVAYELTFAFGPDEAVVVTGQLHAGLEAMCQRCLRLFVLDLEVPVQVLLGARPVSPQPDSEPAWDSVETTPSLGDLIEDELLLALPFLPRHPLRICAAANKVVTSAAHTHTARAAQRPFAGLREALDAERECKGQ